MKNNKKGNNMKKWIMTMIFALAACGGSSSDVFQYGAYKMMDSSTDFPITVNFAADGNFFGKVVNNIMGNYSIGQSGQINITPKGTTMMMGPEDAMQKEQKFLQTMPKITSYKTENGKLILQTSDGQRLEFIPLE